MKNIVSTVSFIFILLLMNSCTDFLTERNETTYSAEYIYGFPEGLKLATTALYALDRNYYNDTEASTRVSLERATDLATTIGGTGNYYGNYNPVYLKPSASQPKWMWQKMYAMIGKCNDIITAGEKLPQNSLVCQAVAEAKAFRAQSYFLLFRTFDRVWLNTESTTPENVNTPRDYKAASRNEVFDLLYADLEYAINNLAEKPEDIGRFTKAAARHLKAKVALWNEDWDTVIEQADSIEMAGYTLVNLENVFNAANLNHNEALFVQQFSKNPGGYLETASPNNVVGHDMATQFIAIYRNEIPGDGPDQTCSFLNWGYTYGRCLPNPYLLGLYDQAKDKRYQVYYIHKYVNFSKDTIVYGDPAKNVKIAPDSVFPIQKWNENTKLLTWNQQVFPGCVKFGDIYTRATPGETKSFKDIIVYRLAETYIMAAEAAFRKGDQTLAKKYYNKTWQRAGNDEFTGTLRMVDIMNEQARELAFEGDRWYFLKRLGKLIEQVQKYNGDDRLPNTIVGRKNLPANPQFLRWPIPESEVINMGADKFPQNPGY